MEELAEIEERGGFVVRVLQDWGLRDKESFSRQKKKEGRSREEKLLERQFVQKIRSPLVCLKNGCREVEGDREKDCLR